MRTKGPSQELDELDAMIKKRRIAKASAAQRGLSLSQNNLRHSFSSPQNLMKCLDTTYIEIFRDNVAPEAIEYVLWMMIWKIRRRADHPYSK